MIEVKLAELGVKIKDALLRLSLASINFRSKRNIKKLDTASSSVLNQFNDLYEEEGLIAVRLDERIKREEARAAAHYSRIEANRKALEEYEDLVEEQFQQKDRELNAAYKHISRLAQ